MKKLTLIVTLIMVFTLGTLNIASAKAGKSNPGQDKKQEVSTKSQGKSSQAPGQVKKLENNVSKNKDTKVNPAQSKKALPSVIKIGRLQLPVNPIVKDLGATVTWPGGKVITITKGTSVITVTLTAEGKKSTTVRIITTTPGGVTIKDLTQKGNGVINPTSYIKSILKVKALPTATPVPPVPSGTPTPTPTTTTVPAIVGASIADTIGAASNGHGTLTLPLATTANIYKYFIQPGVFVVPALGSNVSGWTTIVNGADLNIAANAAEANGKHIGIAETTGSSIVVKFVDITVSGISDYVAATSGKSVGSMVITDDVTLAALTAALDSKVLTFAIDGTAKNYTISNAVKTKADFLTALNTVLGTSGTATFDASNHLQVVSATTGTSSTVVSAGEAKIVIVGTATETVGTAQAN